MKTSAGLIAALCALLLAGAVAEAVSLDFEGLADLEEVTTQFPGTTFSSTVALQSFAAGGSLNELEFPPFSGITVVSNGTADTIGGSIVIDFAAPVMAVGGRFTYATSLLLAVFDLGGQVASATSLFDANFDDDADPLTPLNVNGSAPNELIQIGFGGGFLQLVVSGTDPDATFTLDNLTFTFAPRAVPEPGELGLVALGLAVLVMQPLFTRLVARVRAIAR